MFTKTKKKLKIRAIYMVYQLKNYVCVENG